MRVENRIRALRAERGWSQAALADRIGTSRQTIGSIEASRSEPSLTMAAHIAGAFGLTIEDVFSLPSLHPPWDRTPQAPASSVRGSRNTTGI